MTAKKANTTGSPSDPDDWTSPAFEDTLICPGFLGVGGLESGGDGCLLVSTLVFDWREHVQRTVTSSAVVEDLDVVISVSS